MISKLTLAAFIGLAQADVFSYSMGPEKCASATTDESSGVKNGQYCLNAGSFDEGQCCNTAITDFAATDVPAACLTQPQGDGSSFNSGLAMCIDKNVNQRFIRQFLTPQNKQYCAAYEKIDVTATEIVKSNVFKVAVPNTSFNWHCKYYLSAETKVPDISAADDTKGYIYLVAESYGFDNDVWVYVQPRGKILDFNSRSQTNDPLLMTKVFKSSFGRQFLIPAEYDIYIDYSPLSYKSTSTTKAEEGRFSLLAKWVANTDSYKNDDTIQIVDRLASLATEGDRAVVQPVEEDDASYEILDDTVLAPVDKRISIVDGGKPVDDKWKVWRGEEAFNVGGISVTNEEAAVGSTVILIVIIGIVVICCFVSYLERKKIAEEARRASAYAKRASQKIRRSIKSMRGQDPGPEEPVEARTEKQIKKDAAAAADNKNEKAFLNDMFTEQEKKDQEAAPNNA